MNRGRSQKNRAKWLWTIIVLGWIGLWVLFVAWRIIFWGEDWRVYSNTWLLLFILSSAAIGTAMLGYLKFHNFLYDYTVIAKLGTKVIAVVLGVIALLIFWFWLIGPVFSPYLDHMQSVASEPTSIILFPKDGTHPFLGGVCAKLRNGEFKDIQLPFCGSDNKRTRVQVNNPARYWFSVSKNAELLAEVKSSHYATLTSGNYLIKVFERSSKSPFPIAWARVNLSYL